MGSFGRSVALGARGARNYCGDRPFSVSFEVTHSCNARCKICHLRGMIKDERRASPKRFGALCREIRPVVAQISGGEPLLRKDVEEIVSHLRAAGSLASITTNGSLLTTKRYESLRAAGLDEFSLSLDYPDERHDEFRDLPGLFAKISDLMAWLKDRPRKGMTLCCVVQSDNYRSIPRLAELTTEWGVKLNLSAYTPLRTSDEGYMLTGDQIDEFEEITDGLVARRKKYGDIRSSAYALRKMVEYYRAGRMSDCRSGHRFFNVNPDGTISPCGLIIKDFASQRDLQAGFSHGNSCERCFTSMRASCEKPARYMLLDNLTAL